MKSEIISALQAAVQEAFEEMSQTQEIFSVESTDNPLHGDFATNAAMQLAKKLKQNPGNIAKKIVTCLEQNPLFEKIEIAGPGFINFFLKPCAFHDWLSGLITSDEPLKSDVGKGKSAVVEFVSANPTGPLHIGHGRGAAIGDSVAAILSAAGYKVHKEYYINDAGVQMNILAESIFARYAELTGKERPFPENGYQGDYIIDIAKEMIKGFGNDLNNIPEADALQICRFAGSTLILMGEYEEPGKMLLKIPGSINETLRNFNVNMEEYFSERSLYASGEIDRALDILKNKDALYEKDGALWLNTTVKGDEKDRVLRKSDGTYTYLTPDIAYHNNKIERGFDLLIDVWGADHHGYIKRMEAALDYLGREPENFKVILVQMVNLVKSGEKTKMSTRAGEFITLDWLIDEVGADAARFFYNMRSGNSQFEFDVDLAKSKSSDNPVYYVQYCHARICSLLAGAKEKGINFTKNKNLDKLKLQSELDIIKKMSEFRTVLQTAAQYNEPHRVAFYLQELSSLFHSYYYNTTILEGCTDTANARLNLSYATAKTVRFGLSLLGVSAPEKM